MKLWYTLREIAAVLHLRPRTARRLLAPYRMRCHLAREGSHPRLVLWVPGAVVVELERARGLVATAVAREAPHVAMGAPVLVESAPLERVSSQPPVAPRRVAPRIARSGYLGR